MLNFEYLRDEKNQRKINNILSFILEDRVQTIFKRIKNIRKTKTYLFFKDKNINQSFDLLGSDFKGFMFELKHLDYEINIIQTLLNKSKINVLLDFEREYIKNNLKED